MSRREYLVRATRSAGWWALVVPEVAGVFSQAKRIDQIEAMARDALAGVLEVAPGSFDLRVEVVVPSAWRALVDAAERANLAADAASRDASRQLRESARAMANAGLPYRDVASIMGISAQRVSQLIAPEAPRPPQSPWKRATTRRPAAFHPVGE